MGFTGSKFVATLAVMNHLSKKRTSVVNSKTIALILAISAFLFNARADITTGLGGWWTFDDGPGSSTAADASGNGNDGTLTDFSDTSFTSMWVPGRIGDALLFNTNGDTSDYVSVPDAPGQLDFNTSKAFTLAAWVKLSVPAGSQANGAAIICKGVTGMEEYSLDITGGQFRGLTRNGTGKTQQIVAGTISPVAGVWYHVAVIWSASPQQQFIYINGSYNNTYTGSGFVTSAYNTNHALTIGCKESTVTSGYNVPFQGIIDDVHIYNRVLTPSDIYQLYTNNASIANEPTILTQPRSVACYVGDSPAFSVTVDGSTTLLPVSYQWQLDSTNISGATNSTLVVSNVQPASAGTYTVAVSNFEGVIESSNALLTVQPLPAPNTTNNLAGYWKFDDGSGSSMAADSSTNDNSGTLDGFADTTFVSMWTNGIFNGALAFNKDATGSNVVAIPNTNTPAPAVLDFSANPLFTLSAWANGGTNQTNGATIIAKGTGGGGEQYALDIFGGFYRFYVRDTNGAVFTAQTAVAPNKQWQHVAAVLNATNGIMNCYVNGQLAASTVAPFSLQTNAHEVSIGNRQPGSGAYGDPFTGSLDDVRIYGRDLTSADVAALYAAKPSPLVVTFTSSSLDVVDGATAQLAPSVQGGIPPYTYQWQFNGSNIPGATGSSYVLTNAGSSAAGSYDVIVSDYNYVPSVTNSPVMVTVEPYLTFNNTGVSWTTQGTTPSQTWPGTNVLVLTTGAEAESNSAFYAYPLYVGAFQCSFNYQNVNSAPGEANGATFCIQNDPRGASALGSDSVYLGVGSISGNGAIAPSVEFEFNISTANGVGGTIGVSWDTNGGIGPIISTAPLSITNADIINVLFQYEAGVATVTLTDTNAGTQFSTSTNLNIPALVGSNLAYIGFTGSDGAAPSTQDISSFSYQSLINLSLQTSNSVAVLSWPSGVGGYVLQASTSLATTNWVNVTNTDQYLNGQNTVTVPLTGSEQFYRLTLP
jgi:hypothetical protein